jgi:hypothetical protein
MKKVIMVAILRMVSEQLLTADPELINEKIQRVLVEWSSPLTLLLVSMLVGRSWLHRLWQ